MPIRIIENSDPLSDLSLHEGASTVLAPSHAAALLAQEMRRYVNGEITGRSFLIAGHRGSGKTTLVLDAFRRVLRESKEQEDKAIQESQRLVQSSKREEAQAHAW